jgi:hypothetical protein
VGISTDFTKIGGKQNPEVGKAAVTRAAVHLTGWCVDYSAVETCGDAITWGRLKPSIITIVDKPGSDMEQGKTP